MAKRKTVAKKSTKKKRNVARGIPTRKPKSKSKPKKKPRPKLKQRSKPKPLILTVDLVPEAQWYKNLRTQVRPSVWDKLRKAVYAQAGFKCQICGAEAKGKLNCHEVWEYPDIWELDELNHKENPVQRLVGFQAVCSMCHHVNHIGMASILASRGRLDLEEVVKHFMKVNSVSRKVFEKHYSEAVDIWHYRTQFEWVQDYGQWAALLPEKPA